MSFPTLSFLEKMILPWIPLPHPSHVAFIMDGNRRFARSKGKSIKMGHEMGLSSLKKMLLYAVQLNIHQITIFAFSLENFKRD